MKVNLCLLEKYNNYFNRKIIRYESLEDYQTASKASFIPVNSSSNPLSFDFNPNDNVMTEIIVNDVPFSPDYLLVLDPTDLSIQSRWYVMEEVRNRNGQWTYSLRRDVVSDNLPELIKSPVFVQRGYLIESSPFIVNDEGMRLNQIKKSETLLKDKSGCAWAVGYIARNTSDQTIQIQNVADTVVPDSVNLSDVVDAITANTSAIIDVSTFASILNIGATALEITPAEVLTRFSFNYYAYKQKIGSVMQFVGSRIGFNLPDKSRYYYEDSSGVPTIGFSDLLVMPKDDVSGYDYSNFVTLFSNALRTSASVWNDMPTLINRSYVLTPDVIEFLEANYVGTPIKYNGRYYQLQIKGAGTYQDKPRNNLDIDNYSSLLACLNTAIAGSNYKRPTNSTGLIKTIFAGYSKYYIQLVEMASNTEIIPTLETKISSGRNTCLDQPYDLVCIPFGAINVFFDGGVRKVGSRYNYDGVALYSTTNVAKEIMSQLKTELDASCYDIQLLPYCPVLDTYFDDFKPNIAIDKFDKIIDLDKLTEHKEFEYIWKTSNTDISAHISPFHYDLIQDPLDPTKFQLDGTVVITDVMNRFPQYFVNDGSDTITNKPEEDPDFFDDIPDLSVTYTYNSGTNTLTITALSGTIPTGISVADIKLNLYFNYTESQYPVSIMFYPRYASFINIIEQELDAEDDMKVESNCNFYRVVSPNYQGSFEFNLAKNGNHLDYFTAYVTCKPYVPFVKVTPKFSFLYGIDYNDARGMISSGDFSLAQAQDKWEEFELNNKNYQNIFNREIQSLDFTANLEYRNATIAGGLGVFTDTVKGAAAGGYLGAAAGPVGAIAGAVIGGAIGGGASAAGMAVDLDTIMKQYQENRALSIDKFNYTLGNIRALPYTITKVGSFDVSSKIFPFLEYYTCTDEEKEAFRLKIKYESMTVMKVANFGDFYHIDDELHYFKGELIMNEEIADDPHILDAIYAELLKGVRM